MSLRNTRIADIASLAVERAAFAYHDGRDMTGFVDGTANPPTRLAPHVAMAPPGSPGEGGCTCSSCAGSTTSPPSAA